MELNKIYQGDSLTILKTFPDESVNCCITSPPYWGLRDYQTDGQLGLEATPEEYVKHMVEVFREVKRVLREDGTLWLNIGDSYNANYRGGGIENCSDFQKANKGSLDFMATKKTKLENIKPKDLVGIPWMVAFALRSDGWYLRQDIIWHKPNPMPESVTDRCTKSHEYIFLMAKSQKYYYDNEAIKEPSNWAGDPRAGYGRLHYRGKREGETGTGQENFVQITEMRNKRSVWTVNTKPCKEAHFAVFPDTLITPCILAGCPKGGVVLDCFMGAGTTAVVSKRNNRNYIGIELNPEYIKIAESRIAGTLDQIELEDWMA